MKTECPNCHEEVGIDPADTLYRGDVIECNECGIEIEVVSANPIKLEIYDEEDFWDDDEKGEEEEDF